ncbi:hypothetical protein [Paenibacillus spongiae]|nr:hypothetical protein [Paenibacillus spongiae]
MDHDKQAWTKPELQTLDVKQTEYWAYVYNPETNFWEEVWIDES